jgi:hypothetical protein
MRKRKVNLLQVFALVLGLLLPLVGCQEGPAEAAGRKIDDATRRSP